MRLTGKSCSWEQTWNQEKLLKQVKMRTSWQNHPSPARMQRRTAKRKSGEQERNDNRMRMLFHLSPTCRDLKKTLENMETMATMQTMQNIETLLKTLMFLHTLMTFCKSLLASELRVSIQAAKARKMMRFSCSPVLCRLMNSFSLARLQMPPEMVVRCIRILSTRWGMTIYL